MNCGWGMRFSKAFTLLELLITVFILSLLFSLSMPNFQAMIEQRKADMIMQKLLQSIQFARVSAIRSGTLVTLCKSADGESCGGNWVDGILIFTDADGDRKIDGADELLRHIQFNHSQGTLAWRAFQNRQYLQITHLGFTRYQNGNFTYCPSNADPELARQLIINRAARARYAMDSDGDGIREDSRGRPINCS